METVPSLSECITLTLSCLPPLPHPRTLGPLRITSPSQGHLTGHRGFNSRWMRQHLPATRGLSAFSPEGSPAAETSWTPIFSCPFPWCRQNTGMLLLLWMPGGLCALSPLPRTPVVCISACHFLKHLVIMVWIFLYSDPSLSNVAFLRQPTRGTHPSQLRTVSLQGGFQNLPLGIRSWAKPPISWHPLSPSVHWAEAGEASSCLIPAACPQPPGSSDPHNHLKSLSFSLPGPPSRPLLPPQPLLLS